MRKPQGKKYLDRVQENVDEFLIPVLEGNAPRSEVIGAYKKFLKVEEHRIRIRHNAGNSGTYICQKRSDLVDVTLRYVFKTAVEGISRESFPITLIATGGYGRGLLNPGSDIDLLFLYKGRTVPKELQGAIEEILYMLWDTGHKVGQAVRNIKETVAEANLNNQTKSSLIESRYIVGDKELYAEFEETFLKRCIRGREGSGFLEERLEDLRNRHKKYANTVFLQEPQVKQGCGGLRDFHNLIWTIFVKKEIRDFKTVLEMGLMSESGYNEILKAHDFLLRVRNELHYEAGRANDILTLRLQGVVATNFQYAPKSILRRCEEFMKDYYFHTRNLARRSAEIVDRFHLEQVEEQASSGIAFLARRRATREQFDGFVRRSNRLFSVSDDIFEKDPARLMRIFQHTQLRHLRFSPQLFLLVQKHWPMLNKEFRRNEEVRDTFLAILSRRGDVARSLGQMHRVGFLGRYIPEFGALDCLVQHEFFHRYTADHHTLKVVEELDNLADGSNPKTEFFRDLFHDLQDPVPMYLTILMHDTGRAENVRFHEDASVESAARVCKRLNVSFGRRQLILFLVDHHLTFWRTATTQDISNPDTVAEFAKVMKDKMHLDALYLLTYVDSKGTNDEAWSDWKASLMQSLYRSTLAYWEDREAFRNRGVMPAEELKENVASRLGVGFEAEINAHFGGMPARYFHFRKPAVIAEHIKLFRKFFDKWSDSSNGMLTPVYEWIPHVHQGSSELLVCSWNRGMLLAKVAGAIASLNYSVLSADIYARDDDLVLDTFRVCTTDFEAVTSKGAMNRFSKIMEEAFAAPDFDFSSLIKANLGKSEIELSDQLGSVPARVLLSNDTDDNYTFLEVQAADRIGFLYSIFHTIGRFGLEISHARINTEKGAAVDSIFLQDVNNEKITDPEILSQLKEELERVIGVLPPSEA